MNIKSFFQKYNLDTKVDILESSKTYKDRDGKATTENILYLSFDSEIGDTGQDYLVMSRTLASKVREDNQELAKAQVTETEEGWGLICAATVKVLGTISL